MTEYKILLGLTTKKLEENVNKHLEQGWLLSGGISIEMVGQLAGAYYQAVYKPKA